MAAALITSSVPDGAITTVDAYIVHCKIVWMILEVDLE